ncbi:hypothetical protein WBG99_10910 [Streptomyces sp. TG1A-60]|uniref:hypothetical protein n=1 Tax=Streptomyces sp. TG1A-60 TaxID=3129111 RepID=UPI0030CCE5F3
MTAAPTPGALIRSTARTIARRTAARHQPIHALGSVVAMVDADEDELAFDDLVRILDHHRIPILQPEYDQLVSAATLLGELEWLAEMDIDRLLEPRHDEEPGSAPETSSR